MTSTASPHGGGPRPRAFPFAAVVGHEDAKLALRLAALDPLLGGVLLRGQKGSAKTTLARGLAAELDDAPFVELPLGATEDRVVGSLDTRAALAGGEISFQPGLLAAADGGVLYVDEINLLADHLVDVLLDVSVSGENLVERDGVSHRHPARFVLIGSMNPEEGELRPQLLDRFGLCVDVAASLDAATRVEAVRRRLTFDDGQGVDIDHVSDAWSPDATPSAALGDEILDAAAHLALAVGAEGLRADLTLCRAARALASGESRSTVHTDDLRRVAPLVLAHRSRHNPFDPPVVPPDELEQAISETLDPRDDDNSPEEGDDVHRDADSAEGNRDSGTRRPMAIGAERRPPTSPQARAEPSRRGRTIGDRPAGPNDPIAVVPTVRSLAGRPAGASLDRGDLRTATRERHRDRTVVLCVDVSGSMGAEQRAAAASGTVLGLLTGAYEQRHSVALVTFGGDGAAVVLSPTRSVEVARNRLGTLATGGETPLARGLHTALDVAQQTIAQGHDALLVALTDGRATGSTDALDRALDAAAAIARSSVDALVLDCETGSARLGLAARLADAMGARYIDVRDLDPVRITHSIADAREGQRPD
ncbi:MAG: AAA family ATPase [Actinomycetota bacterium]